MGYFFTIIIPHKNIPSLLQRCLNSIPNRNDLQVIIVDDNSDSDKVDFNHFPGLNNPQCKVIFTKEGKGAGYARNVALKEADSKWVLFADADDYYSENLNAFLDKYRDTDFQTVYFCNGTVSNDTLEPLDEDRFVDSLLKECEIKHDMGPLRYKSYAPWTKMTQLSLIKQHDLRYQEIKASNDSLFNVMVGRFADKFDIYKDVVYMRTIRRGSLAHTISAANNLARLNCGYKVNEFLKKYAPERLYDFHSETWGHFCDLRKISWLLFLKVAPVYFYKTPFFIISSHLKAMFIKRLK